MAKTSYFQRSLLIVNVKSVSGRFKSRPRSISGSSSSNSPSNPRSISGSPRSISGRSRSRPRSISGNPSSNSPSNLRSNSGSPSSSSGSSKSRSRSFSGSPSSNSPSNPRSCLEVQGQYPVGRGQDRFLGVLVRTRRLSGIDFWKSKVELR